jgi:hypothetical protein
VKYCFRIIISRSSAKTHNVAGVITDSCWGARFVALALLCLYTFRGKQRHVRSQYDVNNVGNYTSFRLCFL